MYKVYYGKNDMDILHSPVLEDKGYILTDAVLSLELNTAGSFTFTMNFNHPLWDFIQELKEEVYVYDDTRLLFTGYIYNINMTFEKAKICTCYGTLSILADSIIFPYSYTGCNANTLIERLVTTHNMQMNYDLFKRIDWNRSQINIPNGNSASQFENTDDSDTLTQIIEQIVNKFGGYISLAKLNPRTDTEVNVIWYEPDMTVTSVQEIRFGENLLSLQISVDCTEVITCLYPFGADRLDITSVNEVAYIVNSKLVQRYGYKYGSYIWDSITSPSELLKVATAWLEQNGGIQTLELTAVDLGYINVDIQKFRLGQNVRVVSEQHGLDSYFLINKMDIDLNDISNNTISLGKKKNSLTDRIISKTL